jgi:Transposase DDE domain
VGHVSLDGSKVQANASKHKAMSYGRMKEEDKRLAAEIEALLFRADETDRREDEQYGREGRTDELPEEFQRRDARLRRIREAKAALEKEAAEARAAQLRELAANQQQQAEGAPNAAERKRAATRATKSQNQADELSPRANDEEHNDAGGGNATTELPSHRVPATVKGEPTDKAQRNFTDPESCIMVRNGVFLQAYNAQAAVSESQVIVAHAVTNQPPDQEHLVPMLERVRENCGCLPEIFSADTGYWSEPNAAYCEANALDAYIAVGRKDQDGPLGRLPMTQAQEARWHMHQKVTCPEGRPIYARRKGIVEPVFGQIKQAMGFRRFSLRGLAKVAAEWGIVCLCHNLLKLFRATATRQVAAG